MTPPEDRRLSFDEAVAIYDEIRPSYPAALFDTLLAMLPASPEIIEVGPGTGQATSELLVRGASVQAIEIGPAMAARLRTNCPSERLDVTVGDFEAVGLAPSSVDAVFSATAYHWISRRAQTDRPAHVLRTGGVIAVVDLIQVDSTDDDGFFTAVSPIYQRHGQPHEGPPAPKRDAVDPPMRAALAADPRFGPVSVRHYDWNQRYSAADYRKLMLSYSGTQMMEEGDRRHLLDEVETFVRGEFDDLVTRPLVVTLTTASLVDRAV